MKLVLFGPPGAGKGTQAKLMSEKLSLPHISTGDILRSEVNNKTNLGKEAKGYMDRGLLVPDALVTEMVKARMTRRDLTNGFILDGYPRTEAQAKSLDEILTDGIDLAFYLAASEKTIVARLSGRRVCPKCGTNYHIVNMLPKKDMLCDSCHVELMQRPDDNEATVKNRLKVYLEASRGVLDYYRRQGKLENISGDLEARDVFVVVAEKLRSLKKNQSYPGLVR